LGDEPREKEGVGMNEKQLTQVEAWLEGQARYKLLDCEQTAFLRLKGGLLQIWMCCFHHEGDDQQSWLSNPAVARLTGLTERYVTDARRRLRDNGWMKDTGHVAAIKYINPSQGSYNVPVVMVDNPCKNRTPAKCAPLYTPRRIFTPEESSPLRSKPSEESSPEESSPPLKNLHPFAANLLKNLHLKNLHHP
jgi:hypothetical protein